mgnify:FL=1
MLALQSVFLLFFEISADLLVGLFDLLAQDLFHLGGFLAFELSGQLLRGGRSGVVLVLRLRSEGVRVVDQMTSCKSGC